MDSIFKIDNSEEHTSIKAELLQAFSDKFRHAQLTRTNADRSSEVIVSADDPLHFNGYRVSRTDLIRFLVALSGDLPSLTRSLNRLLRAAGADDAHALNDKNRAVWVDWGYGLSGPRTINNVNVASGKELQLILTAVLDGQHPADNATGLVCATTARVKRGGSPTDPPATGVPNPMN